MAKRELSKYSGSADFDMMGGEVDFSILNNFDIYTVLGGVLNPELKESVLGTDVDFSLKDRFMWEVGASAIIYQWKDQDIQIFGDGNYRASSGLGLHSVTVDGITYSSSEAETSVIVDWQEWQAALGVSKKFQYVIPYGGVVYSDVKTSTKVTTDGATYDLGSASSKYKVGPFIGISILPTKWLSIDVTGRFVAEEAVSGAITVKF